jgi:hypothetical protein
MESKMNDLTPEDRALLDLARGGAEPTSEDRTRIRGMLLARIGVGTGLVGTTAVTSKAAATSALWAKVLAAVAVTGAIGSAGVSTYRAEHAAPMHVVAASGASAAAGAPKHPALERPVPATPETLVALPDVDEAAWGHAPRPAEVVNRAPAPKPPPTRDGDGRGSPLARGPAWETSPATPAPLAPPATTTLEAETRLVQAGVAAFHAGDSTRALALFEEHARLYPRGALAEERAAERTVVLGELRRCDEARVAAASFLRDHASSPLAARVRAVCTATPNL